MTAAHSWTAEVDAQLIDLATNGEGGIKLTTNEIAKRIGRRADVVAKRLHQLGAGRVKLRDAVKPMIEVGAASTCKWVEGDDPPVHYCGEKSLPGKSWCETHYRRVYIKGSAFAGKTAGVLA